MKKGLLFTFSVIIGLGLATQAQKVSGVQKADVTNSKTTLVDGNQSGFYAAANAAHRNNNPSVLTTGTRFSSSYNALTLLVSQSNCLTANQALNAVMFTHRISQDWNADANVSNGYIEYSWTTDYGTSWDSSYYADETVLSNKRFRYPSGAIINPPGNTSVANAWTASIGPYTNGATSGNTWVGYYTNHQHMMNGATPNTTIYTINPPTVPTVFFPRVDIAAYTDSTVWATGNLYRDPLATTNPAFRGAVIVKGQFANGGMTWTFDSIKPNFHLDGDSQADAFTVAHLTFSPDGVVGYLVFFGAEASQTNPSMRTFLPIVYKTTNSGGTWTLQPMNDFSTIPEISNRLIPAVGGSVKPFFSQAQGSDAVVDNNNQLHLLCTVESGSSDDDDSLGFTWTLTGQAGATARHYIYDVHTTVNGWDAWLVDSLMTSTSTSNTIFVDGASAGAAYPTDARIQISSTTDRTKLFYTWVDSDPSALAGENALPDLFGKGVDLTTGLATGRQQFTTSQDFYFHYVSNTALVNGTTYSIAATNSIDRNGSHDIATTFDHYFYNGLVFTAGQFSTPIAIGVEEQIADFGSFNTYPNPANEMVNINLNLKKEGHVVLSLVNTLGQEVLVENRDLHEGFNLVQFNTSAMPAGIYFVNVSSDNGKATSKIVIR